MNWYLGVLKQYAVFSGRARRKEYWFFILFNVLVAVVLTVVDLSLGTIQQETGTGLLGSLYGLAVLLPTIGVSIRRLHDTDRSGWWLLLSLIPVLGGLILLVFMLLEGTPGENRFGANSRN